MNTSERVERKLDSVPANHEITEDLRHLAADVARESRTLLSGLKDARLQASATLRSRLTGAQAALSGQAKRATANVKQAAVSTNVYVKENPWMAVGIALLAGTALGAVARSTLQKTRSTSGDKPA